MKTRLKAEDLSVAREVDVLVVGGGPAGVGAGLAAARQGARTLVVEQFNCLGGVATAGGHGHISIFSEWGGQRRIVGGIAHEIANRVVAEGFGIRNPHGIWFEVEGLKLILDKMAKEAGAGRIAGQRAEAVAPPPAIPSPSASLRASSGRLPAAEVEESLRGDAPATEDDASMSVRFPERSLDKLGMTGGRGGDGAAGGKGGLEVLYYTFFCESIVEDDVITGAVIQNKGGRQVIRAKRVVDCTGDGDVAFTAGCPCEKGRPGDERCQPVTLMFTIGGVDWPRVEKWRGNNYDMREVWEEAQRKGDMEPFQKVIMGFWWTPTRPDQVGINFTHVTGVDSTKAEDLTAATMEARRQAWHSVDVFRKYVPGMERCHMVSTPNTIGIRESRRVMGEYVLTEQDLMAQREFEDNICYGSFFIDIHNIDGAGMDQTTWRPPKGFRYHIPYRVLVPRGVENLLVAGRCISVTHVALGSTRVMVQCMGTGEAAGTAAAVSIRDGVTPRRVDVKKVQCVLRQNGGILSEEDILKANA